MAVATPSIIPMPWASQGQTIDIPTVKPEAGRASWEQGFPPETAIPEAAGGIPPHRLDMQGALTSLSEHIFFQQSGSVYTWNAALDYNVGATILGSDGIKYMAIAESGPSVSAGAVNPTTDALFAYWKPLSRFLLDFVYPVGSIYMNVTNLSPALVWGGSWQPLDQGRVLIGANALFPAGQTGGSNEIRLTTAQLPAHSHNGSTASAGNHTHRGETSSAGGHTHTQGTLRIVGTCPITTQSFQTGGTGALRTTTIQGPRTGTYHLDSCQQVNLDTNYGNCWSGQTSVAGSHTHSISTASAGSHNHTVTVSNTGQGQNISIMQSYLAVYMWQRIA